MQGKREQFSGFNRTLDAINNVFRKFSAFHDETGRLNVDGMNIISNDGSNKLNRSRISRRNIRRRITIPLTLSNLKLLRRITRTENILHRNFTRRQVAIQNRVASNIGISQSTFSVKVLNLFSRSRRKTNKRKSKHSAMLRNKETRHRMFIGLLN